MKLGMMIMAALAASSLPAMGATLAGGSITLSATPTAITSTTTYVQRITVKVIPGFACKVFIGASGHSRSTYSGVYAVLFPNATGGHSEEFTIESPNGNDGINLNTLHLSSDCPGEQVSYMFYQTGTIVAMRVLTGGPVTPPTGSDTSLWGGATNLSAWARVQVIPGMTGKISVKGYGQQMAQLFPNSGNPSQSNAHSEKFLVSDRFGQLRPDLIRVAADVPGESVLSLVMTYN